MFGTMKSTPRQVKEAKKAYNKVVDHLVEEGYAKNKTDAVEVGRSFNVPAGKAISTTTLLITEV